MGILINDPLERSQTQTQTIRAHRKEVMVSEWTFLGNGREYIVGLALAGCLFAARLVLCVSLRF